MAKRQNAVTLANNVRHYGNEPFVADVKLEHNSKYSEILSWYHAMADIDDAREWLQEYFAEQPVIGKHLKRVPDIRINMTAAWIARIVKRGALIPESSKIFLDNKVKEMISYAERGDDNPPEAPKQTVQDHIREKAGDLIADIEGMIDDGEIDLKWSLKDHLKVGNFSTVVVGRLVDYLQPIRDELVEACLGKDKQIAEGYSRYSKKELMNLAALYNNLLDEAIEFRDNTKIVRKPRKKKAVTPEKLLKHFRYAKEFEKLKSIDPRRVIGAQELWAVNTKNNVLAVFRASGPDGLSVNRSKITKYDENSSSAKRIGRKTDERIKQVLESGKVALRKLLDSVSGQELEVPKINDTTILLRVF